METQLRRNPSMSDGETVPEDKQGKEKIYI
jgi:hypothetical protein